MYIPLSSTVDPSIIKELCTCTGIIICGGETELYREYIVETFLGKEIKKMYEQGIPVAGFSAGALISPAHCVIPPVDNSENKHLFLNGLGLIDDCVISVHYSKWNEEENLKTALSRLKVRTGYGIDDDAGLYFENELLKETQGAFYIFNGAVNK